MTNFSSKYEQDMSQIQLECSAVLDFKEKKRLVLELYQKKMLYKCFAGWVNIAFYQEEDEENENDGSLEHSRSMIRHGEYSLDQIDNEN